MKSLAVFVAAFLALAAMAEAEKKVVCYFGSWAVYRPGAGKFAISDIDARLCTHLIYTFVGITTNGDVRVLDAWQDLPDEWGKDGFGNFNRLRQQNPNAKTLIAIGGWNEGSVKYSQVVADPALRAKFVKNVVAFVKKHGFDGFDVDWEYPNQRGGVPADKKNFVLLLKELKEAFQKDGLILSAAVGAAESSAMQSYLIAEMSKYLDFINLMSYDFNGAWSNVAGINAPLYKGSWEQGNQAKLNVDAAVKYWIANGAPKSKLIVGMPFYGRGFTLADPSNNKIGAPTTGPITAGPYTREAGMLGYNEICEYLKNGGWTVKYSEEQRVPYAFKGNQWFGFDDVKSIKEKSEYVNKMGLGGAMLWSIETDDFRGNCGEKYPLLKTMNRVLRPGATVPNEPPKQPNPPVTNSPVTEPAPIVPPTSVCTQEGYVRDQKDCSVFYYCQVVSGVFQPTRFQCSSGLVFDMTIKACNYKHAVPGC